MENLEPTPPLERNPVTHQRHRKETFWQITFPIVIGSLLILALVILTIGMASNQASVWADISIIWLIMPVLLVTLLTFAFLLASIYLNIRLIKVLPFYARQIQNWFSMVLFQVRRLDSKAVEPVLRLQGFRASINAISRNIRRT